MAHLVPTDLSVAALPAGEAAERDTLGALDAALSAAVTVFHGATADTFHDFSGDRAKAPIRSKRATVGQAASLRASLDCVFASGQLKSNGCGRSPSDGFQRAPADAEPIDPW